MCDDVVPLTQREHNMDDDYLGPLAFRPGDPRIREVSHGRPPVDDPWWVERLCGRCGVAVDAPVASLVTFSLPGGSPPERVALCQHCAAILADEAPGQAVG